MVNFLIFVQKNVSTIRFQEIKIRPFQDFEKKAFFSLFLMRKRLSSGQKWFLRPNFILRGMVVFGCGLIVTGAVTLRILELYLSSSPHPHISDGNFTLSIFLHPNIPDNEKRVHLRLEQMKKKEKVKVKSLIRYLAACSIQKLR